MDQDGYVLLSNVLTESEIQIGLDCISNDKVDYTHMKEFIDKIFLKTIQKKCEHIPEPKYVKYRFSNNNNSTDASTFHGDIYNHTKSELLPIYTCLCYFDTSHLEIIPGSHKYNNNDWSIRTYNRKKIIQVNRGDILIFHANIHHRGVRFGTQENRRLLQVFEVFPDKPTYDEHASNLISVQTSNHSLIKNVINPIMYQAAKIPYVIDAINFINYIFVYNDLQYKVTMMDLAPYDKRDKYITYEPGRRVYMDETTYEELNVNVVCDRNIETAQPSSFYLYVYILYWIVSFILIYLIVKWFKGTKVNKSKRKSKRTF
jgi:hypothetical protein